MNHQKFKELSEARVAHCLATLNTKGEEYSRNGERLHNFIKAGRRRGITPEQALLGMAEKHFVSIDDMVEDLDNGKVPSQKMLDEKITDAINYLLLLEALIVDRRSLLPLSECPKAG